MYHRTRLSTSYNRVKNNSRSSVNFRIKCVNNRKITYSFGHHDNSLFMGMQITSYVHIERLSLYSKRGKIRAQQAQVKNK